MDPTTDPERAVYAALEALGIAYECHGHPAVFTVEQAAEFDRGADVTRCKNLFLRNKRGDRHYLLIADRSTTIDLRRLSDRLGEGRLGLASPERLEASLGLTPGAVSPFGLLNNRQRDVIVLIDADLRRSDRIAFHPNVNTATLVLSFADFERFLRWSGQQVRYLGDS